MVQSRGLHRTEGEPLTAHALKTPYTACTCYLASYAFSTVCHGHLIASISCQADWNSVCLQREWAKATGDKDKVIGWPAHLFEQFVIVVSCHVAYDAKLFHAHIRRYSATLLILCNYQQGLPPTTDVKSVISDAERLQTGTWFALISARLFSQCKLHFATHEAPNICALLLA